MQISLKNEVVVVTGGARRLGRAIALECARAGASVVITYNTSKREADQTLEELRAGSTHAAQRFAALQCDLSDSSRILALQTEVLRSVGTPTALVNNAAIFRRTPFSELEYSSWERSFDEHITANLKAPYLLCKVFGDIFVEQQHGAIVNLADIYGARPLKNYVPYCLSKAGVLMLTQALAKALAPHVRVNAISPGTILLPSETQEQGEDEFVASGITDDEAALIARVPMQRLGTPHEIAQAAVFLIGGPQFISGAVLPVDGAQSLR